MGRLPLHHCLGLAVIKALMRDAPPPMPLGRDMEERIQRVATRLSAWTSHENGMP